MSLDDFFPAPGSIPPDYQLAFPLEQRSYLVNGRLEVHHGDVEEVFSPIFIRDGGELRRVKIGSYPALDTERALEVLAAAKAAFDKGRGAWPTLSLAKRLEYLSRFATSMKTTRSEVVARIMWEIGKTANDAEREFDRTIEYIEATIEAAKDLDRVSSRFSIEQGVIGQIRRAPLGVVLCLGPFNYPLNETFTTLLPAILMGNCVVFKPPKIGVLLHEPLLPIFRDIFPPGVVNTVYGDGSKVIGPMMASGDVDSLAFIGSSRVANILKKQHPRPNRLRSILGLEAKNPGIVLPDADLDVTIPECVLGALSFNGQRCTALKILFVHRAIFDTFVERLSLAVDALQPGMPWEKGVKITPLPEEGKADYLAGLVADACAKGARVANARGGQVGHTLVFPTVLAPVALTMRIAHEEQFGPLIPIVPFDSIDEPIDYVVNAPFGQQVSIFGRDTGQIAQLIDPLVNQVCRVNINSQCQRGPDTFPFTGRKDSAEGTLSVSDALRAFSIRTLVATKDEETNRELFRTIVRERLSQFLSTDFIL